MCDHAYQYAAIRALNELYDAREAAALGAEPTEQAASPPEFRRDEAHEIPCLLRRQAG